MKNPSPFNLRTPTIVTVKETGSYSSRVDTRVLEFGPCIGVWVLGLRFEISKSAKVCFWAFGIELFWKLGVCIGVWK